MGIGYSDINNSKHRNTVKHDFDPARFSGDWWEFAAPSMAYNKMADRVTSTYRWHSDKCKMHVVHKQWCKCQITKEKEGWGWAPEKCYPGKMMFEFKDECDPCKVQKQGYIVHCTDYDSYAIVGSSCGRYVWVLTREECVSPRMGWELMRIAQNLGYDCSMLHFPTDAIHHGCKSCGMKCDKKIEMCDPCTRKMKTHMTSYDKGEYGMKTNGKLLEGRTIMTVVTSSQTMENSNGKLLEGRTMMPVVTSSQTMENSNEGKTMMPVVTSSQTMDEASMSPTRRRLRTPVLASMTSRSPTSMSPVAVAPAAVPFRNTVPASSSPIQSPIQSPRRSPQIPRVSVASPLQVQTAVKSL